MESLLTDIIKLYQDNQAELGLSYVDEDYGQLEALDTNMDTYPLTFPAVLISLNSINWTNESHLEQIGTATLSVRLLIDCYDDTHMNSTTIEKAAERNELLNKVQKLVHGFRSGGGGDLTRTDSQFMTNEHGIKVYTDNYECQVCQSFADTKTIKIKKVEVSPTLKD